MDWCRVIIFATLASATTFATDKELSNNKSFIPEKLESQLDVFYFKGNEANVWRAFCNFYLDIEIFDRDKAESYDIYQSGNRTTLLEKYEEENRFFGLFKSITLWNRKKLPPFESTFVGVDTLEPYNICVKFNNVDFVRLTAFLGAICLYLTAATLAKNAAFYYSSSCFLAVLASLLIIGIVVFRLTPKKTLGIPFLLGGWSFTAYLLYALWSNLYRIIFEYQKLVAAYVLIITLVSLTICYRIGPPKDYRSQNIVQWTVQGCALIMIYFSCQITALAFAVCITLIISSLLPNICWTRLTRYWYRLFPKKRLLTSAEYEIEGKIETEKALNELREFCRCSPEANAWNITSRLRSPQRFAEFVSGNSDHLTETEKDYYDYSGQDYDFTGLSPQAFGHFIDNTDSDSDDLSLPRNAFYNTLEYRKSPYKSRNTNLRYLNRSYPRQRGGKPKRGSASKKEASHSFYTTRRSTENSEKPNSRKHNLTVANYSRWQSKKIPRRDAHTLTFSDDDY